MNPHSPDHPTGKDKTALQELKQFLKDWKVMEGTDTIAVISKKVDSLLAKEADDKKKEAIAFAEWIVKNKYVRIDYGNGFWCDESEYEWMGEQNRLVTTEELFNNHYKQV